MSDSLLTFNGIDGRSGNYLLQLEPEELVAVACGEALDDAGTMRELSGRREKDVAHLGVTEGVDVRDLAQAGWGVVFPATLPGSPEEAHEAALLEALRPLLELRKAQASREDARLYQAYTGIRGVRAGESKLKWLARHGAAPGPADPRTVPYYLLLVGDPDAISYRFQSQVGVQRAVGRLHFETVEEYARYAQSVVEAEAPARALPRRASFFGVANPDDAATQASARHLVGPVADAIAADPRFSSWVIERRIGAEATRAALSDLLVHDAPALLFSASHGMGFPKDDPLQLAHQGALLCQDWPGPNGWRGKPIPEAFYLAGEHLPSDTSLLGTLAFFFACYGAGTPALDEFSQQAFKTRAPIAPRAFVAELPRALLNRPKGGALAVVGPVERAWGHSFLWEGTAGGKTGAQTAVFESTIRSLLDGMPVGAAMEAFDERYAELATELAGLLEDRDNQMRVDEYALAGMWTANNDARGYAILGDPAVRLNLADAEAPRPRTPIVLTGVALPGAPPASVAQTPLAGSAAFSVADTPRAEAAPMSVAETPRVDPTGEAVDRLFGHVSDMLQAALERGRSVEVSTWVTEDLRSVTVERGNVVGAELRVRSRVSLEGEAVLCLPEAEGRLDPEIWAMHLDMVRATEAARADLIRALAEAAATLGRAPR